MSIRRIISTGIISSALVLTSGTAALANAGGEHHHHHCHSLLDLFLLLHLGLLGGWGL
jgi:hypothetical protein